MNFMISTYHISVIFVFFFFQAEDGIRDSSVTGVQTCALPIWRQPNRTARARSSCAWWASDRVAPDPAAAGAWHGMLEHGAHDLLANIVFRLDQLLVGVEVFESLLPHHLRASICHRAAHLLDLGMGLADVLFPGLERSRQV